jgi:fatty-acyl-CoA synthase
MRIARRLRDEVESVAVCARAGLLNPVAPHRAVPAARALERYGLIGGLLGLAAARAGGRVAVSDERGSTSYAELDRRTSALANAWRERGFRSGDGVAILARNHRGIVEAVFAACKLGARVILLNTDFAGPQVREVAIREGARMIVFDDEFADAAGNAGLPLGGWRAWTDTPGATDTLEALIADADDAPPPKPEKEAAIVILTSGTTGTPKGAVRQQGHTLTPMGALFGRVPFRSGEATLISAPLFHSLGFAHMLAAVALGSTMVLRRRFDADGVLDDIERHRATAWIAVPVMLRRVLDAYDAHPRDTSSLRIVFLAGSQLGATLATRALDTLGDVVYNLYGSTEVAFATIATPADLREDPDSVGPPTLGCRVRILDEDGEDVTPGETGRIFVGNAMPFEGYTGGGTKEIIDGLMSSGDVGHFNPAGRLFIDGRDDDMIISGGENLFPGEIEELLIGHEEILEAAVIGVPDEEWGARLRAFVVLREGAQLDEDAVKEYVRENLARYKVPREVVFMDHLPRNPTGKVLKRELSRD